MTTTPSSPAADPAAESDQPTWRGKSEQESDIETVELSAALRGRSRRLLGLLLRPHKRALWWAIALLLVQNAAAMAGPYLVMVGIDRGIPPIDDSGDPTVLIIVTGAFVLAALTEYVTKRSFLMSSGRDRAGSAV